MKLPDDSLYAYKEAIKNQNDAMLRLGLLQAEYEAHKARILASAAEWKQRQDTAVKIGLKDLGLPTDDPKRHFSVDLEGNVSELVGGKNRLLLGGM